MLCADVCSNQYSYLKHESLWNFALKLQFCINESGGGSKRSALIAQISQHVHLGRDPGGGDLGAQVEGI